MAGHPDSATAANAAAGRDGLLKRSAPAFWGRRRDGHRGHHQACCAAVCTVVVLVRRDHSYPVLLGANRDERLNRPWDPPAAYWPDQPDVVAGRDRAAGGTWMGVNRHGVVAAILNRAGTLGPVLGKRSRGELPLIALAHDTACTAATAIGRLDAGEWRDFNMILADRIGAVFLRGLGRGHPFGSMLPQGGVDGDRLRSQRP